MSSCPSENNNNKKDDNAPIHISRPDGYDPSRDASGCFFSSEYSELAKGGIAAVVERFQVAARSNSFVQHWSHSGFTSPSFHPNTYLKPGVPAYDKFVEGLQDLGHATRLGLVFHGTSTTNIPAILQNGLDPKRRSGQAYGPGEYFGKNPSISVSYCKGGKEMMVFAVVIPSSLTLAVEEEKKLQKQQEDARKKREASDKAREAMETPGSSTSLQQATATSTLPSQPSVPTLPVFRYNSCPPDFVVVNNNLHQIPIGTMKFTAVDHNVMAESQNKRAKLLQLNKEVFEKSQIAQEGEIKAKIIQLMIAEKIDLAAEKYDKQKSFLKKSSKAEIAWYASQKLDEDVIPAYFPDLPPPMSWKQLEEAKIASVDETTRQHLEAKERLEKEREALYGAKIAEPKKPPAVLVAKNTATASSSSSNTHNATGKTSSTGGAFSSVFSAFSTKAPSSAMKRPANPFKMEGLNVYQRKSLQNRTDAAILGAASTSTACTSTLTTASSSDSSGSGHSDQATASLESNPKPTVHNNGSSTSVNNTSTSPSGGGVGTIQKAVTKLTVNTNASREETKQSKAKTATQNPQAVASFTASAEVFNATTEIIRHLVGDRVDIAAELYRGKHSSLFEAANEDAEVMERKREISQYVYRTIPSDVAPIMFPGLPDPSPTTPRKRKDAPDSSTSSTDSSTTSGGTNNGMDVSTNSTTTSQDRVDQQELWGLLVES